MERLSRLGFLVAVCIVVYFQCVCSSGTTITATTCTTDADCGTANAVCNKMHCACKDAFKDTGAACVANGLNDNCSKAEDCVNVKNATCVSNKCQCSASFKVNGAACAKKVLTDTCSKADECVNTGNATCDSTTHACKCAVGFKAKGAVCTRRVVGDPCTDQKECPFNADCDATTKKCTCSSGFSAFNGLCAKGLRDPCIAATDCNAVKHALCHDKNHICSCSGGFKKHGATCVAKILGAACSSSNKSTVCKVLNTDCISGHCACLNNSYVDENDECKTAVGKTCTNPTDCPSEANCDKTCICKKGYVVENGLCHYAVGTTCTKGSDCVKNADCNKATSKCTCSTGYDDSNGKCSEQKSSADSVKKTINAIVVSFLCSALLNIV